MDVIVLKGKELITVVRGGSRLLINKNHKLFDKLIKLSTDEIKEFILKGGEMRNEK